MNIADLQLFVSVVEAGSIRRAALSKGLDAATLSRRIARLESELGVLLLERGRAGAKPTAAGDSTLPLARKAIADIDAIRRKAVANGRAERGILRLGTHFSTIGPHLRTLLKDWRSQHPEVTLELIEVDDRDFFRGLRDRELSAIVCLCPELPSEIAIEELWIEPLLLAIPAKHPLAKSEYVRWEDVRSLQLLVRSWAGSNAYYEHQAQLIGRGADFRLVNTGTFNLLNLIAIGEGAMFVMDYHRELNVGGVVFRPILEPNATISVFLAWDSASEDPVAGNFVAFIRDRAKRRSSQLGGVVQTLDPSP